MLPAAPEPEDVPAPWAGRAPVRPVAVEVKPLGAAPRSRAPAFAAAEPRSEVAEDAGSGPDGVESPCDVTAPAPAPASATVAATAAALTQPAIGSAYWPAEADRLASEPSPPNQRRLRKAGSGSSAAIFSRRPRPAASAATSIPARPATRRQAWQWETWRDILRSSRAPRRTSTSAARAMSSWKREQRLPLASSSYSSLRRRRARKRVDSTDGRLMPSRSPISR